ncbi:hypothetical protein HMPREF9445_00906 [Bacteroides clarus YIT 12056]|uniref:Uncharacterized protein n=1 Tax=Bacteroides clarus YIT 12056 TaxID=762984 RepID=A0ABN0CQW3_9BACE|nr:hypothetical protein HMPREF9445_00906 [Bacteroides clarus YIT 12056]
MFPVDYNRKYGGVFFLSLKDKEIIVWMIGSVIGFYFFPYLKGERRGNGGKEGEKGCFL